MATLLETVQFPYLKTWKVFKECEEGGLSGHSPHYSHNAVNSVRMAQRKLQLATGVQFTIKRQRQPILQLAVAFWKMSFKHRSIQIKGNFTLLTLHLCIKCIMY
jgi:hypothetical protein